MFNLILLGPPASGKATQAELLLRKYKLLNLDMGKQLRGLRKKVPVVNAALKNTTDKGGTTPTKIVRQIFRNFIFNSPAQKGVLFNGTPKMIGEAKFVRGLLEKTGRNQTKTIFIYLHIPDKEIIRRILRRGKLQNRADDNLQAVRRRLKYTKTSFQEVVDFFKRSYDFRKVNGIGSISAVHNRITKVVNELTKK